ncbi:MAG: LamG domain-containing protein [Tannerella sp.]|jgi:hypothetical protein|nr:LamG domain-containing protein [Tannerella sp.]
MNKKIILSALFLSISLSFSAQISKSWNFENTAQATGTVKNVITASGVVGNAAVFDGYTSDWEEKGIDIVPKTLFVEAWVAPLDYSFNVSAIVNQQNEQNQGFIFGINHNGQLVATFYAGGEAKTCISDESTEWLKWSHVALTYEEGKGIRLFLNGALVKTLPFAEKIDFCTDCPLVIGKTQIMDTPAYTERTTSRAVKSWMRFNGRIDELHISDKIPDAKTLQKQVTSIGKAGIQALEKPQMPSADIPQGPFGAFYTRLHYTAGWEALWKVSDHADVVVRFPDSPVKYVFWRGTGYIPAIVSENNIWMTDQSLENWGSGECYEVMGDKQCRYSHVRIIESTPARVVIHWRYALAGIHHQIMYEDDTGWGDWADEYWTIYPDGVGIRKQILHSGHFKKDGGNGYQFQETILFNQPGTKPQDNLNPDAISFSDMEGHIATYSWEKGAPAKFTEPVHHPIQRINIKAEYKPFSIFPSERITKVFDFGWVEGYSTFPCWNHWPVSQIRSDGRNATRPDKPSHTSLTAAITGINGDIQEVEYLTDNTILVRQMMGMTTEPIQTLLPLARSWNNPPAVKLESAGYDYKGYDKYQRAYLIEGKTTGKNRETLQFTVQASESAPIHNMAFVLENWNHPNIKLLIDGKKVNVTDFKTGFIQTLASSNLTLWVPLSSTRPVSVTVKAID